MLDTVRRNGLVVQCDYSGYLGEDVWHMETDIAMIIILKLSAFLISTNWCKKTWPLTTEIGSMLPWLIPEYTQYCESGEGFQKEIGGWCVSGRTWMANILEVNPDIDDDDDGQFDTSPCILELDARPLSEPFQLKALAVPKITYLGKFVRTFHYCHPDPAVSVTES